jgi:TorA maturation chaperone TorD
MNDITSRKAFWLTLANAFLPPLSDDVFQAFRDALADDLAALCADIELDATSDIAALRHALDGCANRQALLVDYSHLFLQPPIPATLNLARHVDGALNGACMDALEEAYRAAGVERRETLRDLPDHAAMQMETLALLLGETGATAGHFARICLVGALPRLAVAIAGESPGSPYAPLARIAAAAIAGYAEPVDADAQKRRQRAGKRADTGTGVWRHCGACGKPFAREKELAIMAKALAQAGLPAEHLALCPDCRDATQGFFKRAIS